ncbi:hypothetical protein SSX86_022315 [Deinandra increscens subsp. villosa]|uniref:Uncharacterized protein n=1 Tax=Deinandra increscens subsp. villosa TaxID=3103831 RepID=A0AAP0GR83_9ASTR
MVDNVDLELQDLSNIRGALPRLLHRVNEDRRRERRLASRIRMVPDTLRDLSESSFNPRVVSIGPLHRDDEIVKKFEAKKADYVVKLIKNMIPSPRQEEGQEEEILKSCLEEVLKSCVNRVSPLKKKVQEGYEWNRDYEEDEFIEFMVMDACFILGFIFHISKYPTYISYRKNILRDHGVIYDLVLIENQIPLFFLNEIFQCTVIKFQPNKTLFEFLNPLLNLLTIFDVRITSKEVDISTTDNNLLSLLYECYKPDSPIQPGLLSSKIRSVVDLDSAGVNFKPNYNPKWQMGMDVKLKTFPGFSWCWGKPTLIMPPLYVDDFTEVVLRNLIAYEHESSMQTHAYVLSYAYFMGMLVNTQEDVDKLVDAGVIINVMGSNREAASMMKTICKEIAREQFFYDKEWDKLDMDKYCIGYLLKSIIWLKRTYFNSPWNVIALFAGIILFVLTVIQTIFTVKSAS